MKAGFLILVLLLYASLFAEDRNVEVADLFSGVSAVRVQGNLAYGVSGAGLRIYDITERNRPRLLSQQLINNNRSFDLEVIGSFVYVLSGSTFLEASSISVIDVRNPFRPKIVSRYDDLKGARAKDLIAHRNILIVSNANRVDLLDLSNPGRLQRVGSIRITGAEGFVDSFSMQGSTLFAVWGNFRNQGIVAVDVSNPVAPRVVSRLSYAGGEFENFAKWPLRLVVYRNALYVSRIAAEADVFNVADPKHLKRMGTLPVIGSELFAGEDYLFLQTGGNRVAIFDTQASLSPKFIREVEWSGTVAGMDLRGLTALVSWTEPAGSGMAILDFTADGRHTILSRKLSPSVSDVVVLNDTTFITASNRFLAVKRKPGRLRVEVAGRISFDANLTSLKTDRQRAYIATVTSEGSIPGVQIVDISDPERLLSLGSFQFDPLEVPSESSQPRFDVKSNLLFLAVRTGGMRIYNVSNPARPRIVGFFPTPRREVPLTVTVSGDVAYLTTSRLNRETFRNKLNLHVIDVGNPSIPRSIARIPGFDNGDFCNHMTVYGDYLYIAGGGIGIGSFLSIGAGKLYIFDIGNPEAPRLLSKSFTGKSGTEEDSSGYAEEVHVSGDTAFVADGLDGVTVFSVKNKSRPTLQETLDTPHHARGIWKDADRIHIVDSSCYLVYPGRTDK